MTVHTSRSRADAVAELVALLTLERDGDLFRAECLQTNLPQVFGGQLLAQCLLAAADDVPAEMPANSMHAHFLRAGNPSLPLELSVDPVRDGRRLACRVVTVHQSGRPITTATVSFASTSGGVSHDAQADPAPATLPPPLEIIGGPDPVWIGFDALEIRGVPQHVRPDSGEAPRAEDSVEEYWMRVAAPLPHDPVLHQALTVFLSDVLLISAALVPHGVPVGYDPRVYPPDARVRYDGMSLDHAIWFHRPIAADTWLRFGQRSPIAADGRALSTCTIHAEDGRLVATVAQEGLIYAIDPPAPGG